jgi:hypothetical protein
MRKCACGGGCPNCKEKLPLQTKLSVSEPGDALEREADAVADSVLRMSSPPTANIPEQKSAARIARAVSTAAVSSRPSPSAVHETVRTPGQPLDDITRNYFEPRFGRDFGDVRIHADAESALTANALSARAYTVGRDVVFGAGEYAPQSSAGRRLLAHELAHVVQQDSQPAQVMRDPIPGLDPSTLSDDDLMLQMQEARDWLGKHVMMETEYGPMQDYLNALEQEYYTRQTPSDFTPAIVSAVGQSISLPWPPPPEVCVAPSKVGQTMMPDDATNFLVNQRGFTSTAPRTTLDALGDTVVTRPALSPFDSRVFGKELGLGFETHAVIQIYDAKGNIVAEDIGAFFKKGQPHAEMQAMGTLLPRLENVDVTGGKMVVIVDQVPCAGQCGPGLKVMAQNMGLESYEVHLPLRSSIAEPGVPVSPKTTVRGAMLPGRPPVDTYLVEGVTFTPTQSNINWPAITTPPPPKTPPLSPTWADDLLQSGKTSPMFLDPNWEQQAFPEFNPLKLPNAPGGTAAPEFTLVPPKVPWYRGPRAQAVGNFGKGLVLGYVSNEISEDIIESAGIDLPEKDKTAFSLGTSALPPGVNILVAAEAVFMGKVIYEPVIKGFYEDSWNRYKEMNPDATPEQYNDDMQYWEDCRHGHCPD